MFRVSHNVFMVILDDLEPFLLDGNSTNVQQNIIAPLKLAIALYYMAHGGDAAHLEMVSGLSKPTALKYLHQVAELMEQTVNRRKKDYLRHLCQYTTRNILLITSYVRAARRHPTAQ